MAGGMVVADVGGRARDYNGRVTWYVVLVALSASSGGLLFGYDLGITGDVESFPDFLNIFFPEVRAAAAADNNVDPYCSYDSCRPSPLYSFCQVSLNAEHLWAPVLLVSCCVFLSLALQHGKQGLMRY